MRISPDLYAELIAHAREEAPKECCGLIAASEGTVIGVHRATNAADAPRYRFEIDRQELYDLTQELGDDLDAIYHSHPRTAPEPSLTDIEFAKLWPGITWIIVGYAESDPQVRAWLIDGGEATETELSIG